MRRLATLAGATVLSLAMLAGPAFAAHCINQSKPDGSGDHGFIVVDAATEQIVAFSDGLLNEAGRFTGGFVDVQIDVDSDGVGDFTAVEDTFLAANHSLKLGEPFVVPGAFHNPSDQGISLAH